MGRSRSAADTAVEDAPSGNHYSVMGIHDFATSLDAKRAYHRLALLWHPDRQVHASNEERKEAEDRFKRINEAYAVLSDEVRRKQYDIVLRGELLGVPPGTDSRAESSRSSKEKTPDPKVATNGNYHTRGERNPAQGPGGVSIRVRLVMCPECGVGAEAKPGKKGGPSLQCQGCGGYFHEVYCADCKDWGVTRGRRGGSTMRCGCGNVFCQSRCPTCCRWNTFNGEAQGGRTRSCGFCANRFHEAFCPSCRGWGVWEGEKGCRSLSCDCGGLFYEISCQSCGMWGSIKGRHADASNSLCCGTCGYESHEAFCPSCGQWECFLGAKGESTLCCRSSRCRGGKGSGAGVNFFQVYCQSCTSWRSVLGEKDAVGNASIRCEGCMSTLQGVVCPACGNWDQKQHPTTTSSPGTGTANGQGEGSIECRSCGHRPPDGEENNTEDITISRLVDHTVTGVNHSTISGAEAKNGGERQQDGIATGTILCAVGTTVGGQPSSDTTPIQEDPPSKAPKLAISFPAEKNSGDALAPEDGGLRERPKPNKDTTVYSEPPVAFAPTHGGDEPRTTKGSPPLEKEADHQLRDHVAVSTAVVGGEEHSNVSANCAGSTSSSRGTSTDSGTDCADDDASCVPRPATSTRDVFAPRAPPVRSRARRGGHRPPVQRRASRATVPATTAAAETPQQTSTPPAQTELEVVTETAPIVGAAAGTSPHAALEEAQHVNKACVQSAEPRVIAEVQVAALSAAGVNSSTVLGVNGSVSDVDGEGDSGEAVVPPQTSAIEAVAAELSSRETDSPRRKSSNKINGRRKRRASSSSTDGARSTNLGASNTSRTETLAAAAVRLAMQKQGSSAAADLEPKTVAVALAAVPREGSPPPPPVVRIGHTTGDRSSSEGGENDQEEEQVGVASGGRGHAGDINSGEGSRRGRHEVIHLAFCSRCQEYQSWRAPVGDARGRRRRDGARRNCGQCGDAFCNVSYYPTR